MANDNTKYFEYMKPTKHYLSLDQVSGKIKRHVEPVQNDFPILFGPNSSIPTLRLLLQALGL